MKNYPLRNSNPQIADSSLLTPVFVFGDDSVKVKKDTTLPDTTFRTTPLDSNDSRSDSSIKHATRQSPQNTARTADIHSAAEHFPVPLDSFKNDTLPLAGDTRLVNTAKVDSSNILPSPLSKQKTTTHIPVKRFEGERQTNNLSNIFFITELLLAFMLVSVRSYQRRLFRKFLQAFFSVTVLSDLYNESKNYSTPVFWIGFVNYIVQIGFFVTFYISKTPAIDRHSVLQFSAIVFTFNIIKYIIYRISGVIFDQNELFARYGLYHFITLFAGGIVLLVVNVLFVYAFTTPEIVNVGGYFLITLFIFKQIRFIFLSLPQKVSGFHIFLYLCTLEILPFIVAYNWFNL
jgi:hypothetical protein